MSLGGITREEKEALSSVHEWTGKFSCSAKDTLGKETSKKRGDQDRGVCGKIIIIWRLMKHLQTMHEKEGKANQKESGGERR